MPAPDGFCRICGVYGKLSFEHVPPESAFNNRPVRMMGVMDGMPGEPLPKGREQQKGAGAHTLCESCNNKTGHWYGTHFAQFCHQAAILLELTGGKPTMYYPYYISPLSVVKQIICIFFSVNGPEFREENPELVEFVLSPERYYLNPKYRFGIFYQPGRRFRSLGKAGKIDIKLDTMEPVASYVYSEFVYFPFGYTLSIDFPPPDVRLIDISHFARYPYKLYVQAQLRLPVMTVNSFIPGDYGSFAA